MQLLRFHDTDYNKTCKQCCMQTNWRHNIIITRATLWYFWLHKTIYDICISTTGILAHWWSLWKPCTFQILLFTQNQRHNMFTYTLVHNIVQMSVGHLVILVWMSQNHPVLLAWQQVLAWVWDPEMVLSVLIHRLVYSSVCDKCPAFYIYLSSGRSCSYRSVGSPVGGCCTVCSHLASAKVRVSL